MPASCRCGRKSSGLLIPASWAGSPASPPPANHERLRRVEVSGLGLPSCEARKAHLMGLKVMEEKTDYCNADTIPIPILDIERKTISVFCPWCNRMAAVAIADVMRYEKIAPVYKACGKCQDFINEGMVFIRGGNSSLSRWLVSFCRQIRAFRGK